MKKKYIIISANSPQKFEDKLNACLQNNCIISPGTFVIGGTAKETIYYCIVFGENNEELDNSLAELDANTENNI